MELKFAGVGSAFTTKEYWQSNMIVSHDGKNLLIDCGGDIRFSLAELNMSYKDIDAVYISHLHADHIGGLEWLGFCTYFDPKVLQRPKMYIAEKLVEDLWETLKAGMQLSTGKTTLHDFFDVNPIKPNESFNFGNADFFPVEMIHMMSGNKIINSYGLANNQTFITTDIQFCPNQIQSFYEKAEIIFHDCETSLRHSGVHAHYDDLKTLPKEIKSKMYLYHYQPNPEQDPIQDGFAGFVRKGDKFYI